MLKHADVFVFYRYGQKISPLLNKDSLASALSNYFMYEITPKDLDNFFWGLNAPKDGVTIAALARMGFQPKTIAEWMDVNKSTVSYHLNKPNQGEYVNYYLNEIQQKINFILLKQGETTR